MWTVFGQLKSIILKGSILFSTSLANLLIQVKYLHVSNLCTIDYQYNIWLQWEANVCFQIVVFSWFCGTLLFDDTLLFPEKPPKSNIL